MTDMNIRITRRTGSIEEAIDIEFAKPLPLALFTSKIEAIARPPASLELEWSPTLCDGERINYAKAEKACADLGEGWRLPTRLELE